MNSRPGRQLGIGIKRQMAMVTRRRLWLAAIAVLIAVVAGCAAPVSSQRPTGWIRSDLKPVSQPVVVDGRLVLYVQTGGGLQVVALDPTTGRTLWHDDASPGDITPGEAPYLGGDGSIVVFLRPVDNKTGSAQVVGVDAATGQMAWRSPTGNFADWPLPCFDDSRDVCTTGPINGAWQPVARHIRASDGALLDSVVISQSSGARGVGGGLFDLLGTGQPEELVAASADSVAWTRPLASVFPDPGASTLYGWNFDRVPSAGLYVGWVGEKPVSVTKSLLVIDFSKYMTAGFRISDGMVVWRNAGSQYACTVPLPCPGTLGAGYRPPTEGLRLRVAGTAKISGATPRLSSGADVVVEGFSLATGKTLWSYDAGPDGSLTFAEAPPLLGPYMVALPAPGGGMVALNLATGTHTSIPARAVAWCQSIVTYQTQVGWKDQHGKTQYLRLGEGALAPCRASGAPAATPKTVPGFVGTVIDGLTVWSESSKVVAAPTT